MILSAGCVSTQTQSKKVDDGVGNKQLAWENFKENRPEQGFEAISDEGANKALKGISEMYGVTSSMLDKTVERTEHCHVALKLEKVRTDFGDEAFNKELGNLSAEEKLEYDAYVDSEINALSTVSKLLTEAVHLEQGLLEANYIRLALNPFEYKKVYGSIGHAKEQAVFSVKALSWMKDYRDALDRARNYKGR